MATSVASGRGGRRTVYLEVRGYTGQDTQVLWASPGRSTPAYLFILLFTISDRLAHHALNDMKIL